MSGNFPGVSGVAATADRVPGGPCGGVSGRLPRGNQDPGCVAGILPTVETLTLRCELRRRIDDAIAMLVELRQAARPRPDVMAIAAMLDALLELDRVNLQRAAEAAAHVNPR